MKKIICALLSVFFIATCFTGCKKDKQTGLVYPDEGYANAESDSWEQLDPDAEEIEINWFVNLSYWGTAATDGTKVMDLIYEKTKIKINYVTPALDDGAQLSTMISGNKLPDVITVVAGSEEATQLANEGYVYPIQTLAEKYAPSLLNRIDQQIIDWYSVADGNIYGLPNHAYTDADMDAYSDQEGIKLNSNGALIVREDYLNQYTRTFPDKDVTTASGFLEMCKWVKARYKLDDNNPTFMLDSFSDNGSNGVTWLLEYFMAEKEDENGELVIAQEDENYRDALLFLNTLFREKLISPANLTASQGTLSSYLQQGMPFAFIGSPQLYVSAIGNAYKNGIKYVPVVITNDKKEAPLLSDLSGKGWLFSMITNNCKHPDRVIKLFDFLWSEEGQSTFFGIQGDTFSYEIEPGETVDGKTYKYGRIQWENGIEDQIINGDVSKIGFMYSNIFVNPMYPRLASPDGAVLNSFNDYIDMNIKAAICDYTYSANNFSYTVDVTDDNYKSIFVKETKVNDLWNTYIPQIITASSAEEALNIYNATVQQGRRLGAEEVVSFRNVYFKQYKQKIGIKYAWPKNDPDSFYKDLKVTDIRGNTSYNYEIPEKYL